MLLKKIVVLGKSISDMATLIEVTMSNSFNTKKACLYHI